MKDFGIGLIVWVIIIVMGLRIFSDDDPYKYVGETITIIDKEYMITDYSLFHNHYRLNNGAVINKNLVYKLKE